MAARDDGVTTVELGHRRRWPWLVAGVLVAWVVAAVVVGSGADGEPDAATTSSTAASTSTTLPPTTSTTATVLGAPFVPGADGLALVAVTGTGEPIAVDLGTGEVRTLPQWTIVASRPDGVFTIDAAGIWWRPFPFDDATAVALGDADFVFPVPGAGPAEAWLVRTGRGDEPDLLRLVPLDGGGDITSSTVPEGATVVGAGPAGLVLALAGDTFVVDRSGTGRRVDGQAWIVSGNVVLVRRCEQLAGCSVVAADLVSAGSLPTEGLDDVVRIRTDATYTDGRPLVQVDRAGGGRDYGLLDDHGVTHVLPADLSTATGNAGWTPDGRYLLIRTAVTVHVVEPFAVLGPVDHGEFRLGPAVRSMFVVGADAAAG